MYPVIIITKTTTYIQKRGWGSEPPTQTTTSYEGVSPTLLPASTLGACSVSCSLGSWWLFRAQTSATPPKFFPTLCNQRYGATPSFGICRLIRLAPLGDLWPNAQTRLNHVHWSVRMLLIVVFIRVLTLIPSSAATYSRYPPWMNFECLTTLYILPLQ